MEVTAGLPVHVAVDSSPQLTMQAGKAATQAVSAHSEKVVSQHSCQITCLTSCFVTDIIVQEG
jgi:hypothetical protein